MVLRPDQARPAAKLTWDQVLAWRMGRQHLTALDGGGAVDIARRLCGVQAQLRSAAALAVAVRQARPDTGSADRGLADRALVRTWAMRGTLHLLPVEDAGAYLTLLAAARTWERPTWQRHFITVEQVARLGDAVTAALAGGAELTRDELVSAILALTGDQALGDQVRSGWSAVLKPLAWQGLICQGQAQGNRITFVRPDAWSPGWTGLPDPDTAAVQVLTAYLGAHGPVTPEVFDQWLSRGATAGSRLRQWFAELGDQAVVVDVEGTPAHALVRDLEDLAAAAPVDGVRLLPAFDQYLLGPGTGDPRIVPPERRGHVSRAAGWIAPVVLHGGRVVGTWSSVDGVPVVELFPGRKVPGRALAREVARLGILTSAMPPVNGQEVDGT